MSLLGKNLTSENAKVGMKVRLGAGQFHALLKSDQDYTIQNVSGKYVDLKEPIQSRWRIDRFFITALPPAKAGDPLTADNAEVGMWVKVVNPYTAYGRSRFDTKRKYKITKFGESREFVHLEGVSPSGGWDVSRFVVAEPPQNDKQVEAAPEVKAPVVTPELAQGLLELGYLYGWQLDNTAIPHNKDLIRYAVDNRAALEVMVKKSEVNPADYKVKDLAAGFDTVAHYMALYYKDRFAEGGDVGKALAARWKEAPLYTEASKKEREEGISKVRIYPLEFLHRELRDIFVPF